jgi:glycopeptide antibiotics resistance protein
MSVYIRSIMMALVAFLGISFVMVIPWTLYQYRKHGYFSFWRNLILFTFIFYLLSAFFLVSLPLPASRANFVAGQSQVYSQLHLFQFISDIKRESQIIWMNPRTYMRLRHSPAFFQALFNILMLMPLGVYYRFFAKEKRRWWKAIGVGLILSLFIEISQRTALFGYYQVPYRLFDVDDLLTNTLGAFLGYLLAPFLLFLIPSRTRIQEQDLIYQKGEKVSYGVQLAEWLLTGFLASFIAHFGNAVLGLKESWQSSLLTGAVWVLLLVIMPYFGDGRTLGGMMVRLRFIQNEGGYLKPYLKRLLLIGMPLLAGKISTELFKIQVQTVTIVALQLGTALIVWLMWFLIYVDIIRKWIKKDGAPYFNSKSGITAIRNSKN